MHIHIHHTLDPINLALAISAIVAAGSIAGPVAELVERRLRDAWEAFKRWSSE